MGEKQSVNLISTVLEITAPVFALACIGFVWVRLGLASFVTCVRRGFVTLRGVNIVGKRLGKRRFMD